MGFARAQPILRLLTGGVVRVAVSFGRKPSDHMGGGMSRAIGRELNRKWEVGAVHALYSERGNWYHLLKQFPGALFDSNGYVRFDTEREYRACPELNIGEEINVPKGINAIPGYVRIEGED